MVTLPQVDEDQEEDVCRVLEIRFKELIQDDDTERKQSVHVPEPGYKKTSKMVPTPDLDPAQNVVDVTKLVQEVIPRNTDFLRPLLYTD
jgi:hypothetical protein